MTDEQERESFETWAEQRGVELHKALPCDGRPPYYADAPGMAAWEAWKARAAIETDRQRRVEPDYLISACYFPGAGEVELTWERKSDGAKAALTCKVTPEQGKQIANVVWPCVYHTATPQPAEPDEERLAMEAVMESVDPATWPGLTLVQRCALGRFAKPQPAAPKYGEEE